MSKNIVLRTLEWDDIFSYGKNNKIDFTQHRVSQLCAPNGSGKTSIALILQEFLFSKNVKGLKKGALLHKFSGAKTWKGKLTFTVNENLYVLSVSRTGESSKVSLSENNKDISEHKIPDTYKKLSAILGQDFEVFVQLTYQSSKDLLEFINTTDTKRKQFLINLFNLERYLQYGESIKVIQAQVEKELSTLQGELNGIIQFLDQNPVKEPLEMKTVPTLDKTLVEKRALLQVEIDNYRAICSKIDKNNLLIKEQSALQFEMGLEKPENPITDEIKVELETITRLKGALSSELARLQRELKQLNLADKCYVCGQHVDNSVSVGIKASLEEQITDVSAKIKTNNARIEEINALEVEFAPKARKYLLNERAKERFETLSQLIDANLPKIYPDIDAINVDYKNLTSEIQQTEKIISETTLHNNNVLIHNTKIEALNHQRRNFLARQMLLNDDILKLKSRVFNFATLRKAFSTTGIVAFKLENLTKEFEETINQYLSELSDGQFQVVFRLDNDKLNVVVIDQGVESPIDAVSGGEFGRIQTSILLAIRSLLSKLGGSTINLLFLDEITGVLDTAGKEKLIETLLQEEALNVFLISHDFDHPLVHKINIIKENKISRIEQ